MATIEGVIFDFIGTLTELIGYSLEKAENKMLQNLIANGYEANRENLSGAYRKVYQHYRKIRYETLIEVTNAVWISEALNDLGYKTTPQDSEIKTAVQVFFEDYLDALKLRPYTRSTLETLLPNYKLGIISNFTFAPVIHEALRKRDVEHFFQIVLVSEAFGWRKPSPKIFQEALKKLKANSTKILYVGDTPIEDIQGATKVGMKTVFIPSQFNSLNDMERASPPSPDWTIERLSDLLQILDAQVLK